ncbi:hypothetical protein SYNPS1DRAFT_28482 [Syncephalis pseudoplumigaleata]|uniref:Uncharacterized protein n=1 Tax=Syncephalis pseudoplumigaleata TaxID=1712513 RepID=A0A4P9Z066_9FUNG|nr:hypothetical protein SYNPS1DRAFT_28482 [Syncephalis pseudoplumigaleata]|eukprot:RKP25796.1 hypothetical protein SYNPS1DRAFT_28482 [Syncephalis pseudoplumigaleata]
MASSGIRPRSIVRPGGDYEQPKVFGRPTRPTSGQSKSTAAAPTTPASGTSPSTEIGSRLKRTFGLNRASTATASASTAAAAAAAPSKIAPSSSSSSRASSTIPERSIRSKPAVEPKRLARPGPAAPRPAVESLDTEQIQALSSRVSRFGRPPPVGQKSGLRMTTEGAALSSHRRAQSMADNGPSSAPLPSSKAAEAKAGRFGWGSRQPSPSTSVGSKKTSISMPANATATAVNHNNNINNTSTNNSNTLDTDDEDEFDVDRLVDDLRQTTRARAASRPAAIDNGNNHAKETSRHRRHHSYMGSPATIAGDIRAGWSAAASAALERARLRAAAGAVDPSAAAKSPTLERNGARSATGSIEDYRASRSATPASTPPSRQSNNNTPLLSQAPADRRSRAQQRRAHSDESVPTLSSGASHHEPSPPSTTTADGPARYGDPVQRASMTSSPRPSASLMMHGQAVAALPVADRLINVGGHQDTYQSLIGALQEQKTPPLPPMGAASNDLLPDTVSEHSNSTIRTDWLARARARGGSTVEPEEMAAAAEQQQQQQHQQHLHHRRRSSLLDEKYFSADDTRTISATDEDDDNDTADNDANNDDDKKTAAAAAAAAPAMKPSSFHHRALSSLMPPSSSASSSSSSSLVAAATSMEREMAGAHMMRKASSSSMTSSTLANATIVEEEDGADQHATTPTLHRGTAPLSRSVSLHHERPSRSNSVQLTTSSARTSFDRPRPFDDAAAERVLDANEHGAAHPSLLDGQRRVRRLSLHHTAHSVSAVSRFRRSDPPEHTASSLSGLSRPATSSHANSPIIQRSALPSQWTRNSDDAHADAHADADDRNAAVDEILQAIDADDQQQRRQDNDEDNDPLQRKRAVRSTLRTLNGKIADDSSTDADSPRLSVRTSIEGLRTPRGVASSRIVLGSHAAPSSSMPAGERAVHARSMSDFPDAILAGDYSAVRELIEARATASTADGFYPHGASTIASARGGRASVSAVTTPVTATSPYRQSHRMQRTGSLASASSIERFNTRVLYGAPDIECPSWPASTLAYVFIYLCAHHHHCFVADMQRHSFEASLPAGIAVSPRLAPVITSTANDPGQQQQQHLNPHGALGRSTGPSIESRLDEVVESSIRLDRILRQVSADLRNGHTTEASQAVLELWRDSEQVVRGLTDVLLGLSAGVPRTRSPAVTATAAIIGESPRATPTRAYRATMATGGMSGRVSAGGRHVPTPLQLPTPVSDQQQQQQQQQQYEPTTASSNGDSPMQVQYRLDEGAAPSSIMATIDPSNSPPKSAAAIAASSGSIRRQRALSQLISPATRANAFFAPSTPTTATATTPTTTTTTTTTALPSWASLKNATRHTRARTITSAIPNDHYGYRGQDGDGYKNKQHVRN